MLLHSLISELIPDLNLAAIANPEIAGISEDSRCVQPGDLFIARSGTRTEGAKFIGQAIQSGAAAILTSEKSPDCPIPQIIFPHPGDLISPLAHGFFGHPSRQFPVIGITGTNGKTTTAYLIRYVLNQLDHRCGMIGTVQTDDGVTRHEANLTTPGAIEVARLLATMRDNACRACAMEASSHALDQGRVTGVHFAAAAFTNLTQDHLDYHKDMQHYAAAKAKLFEMLDERAIAITNGDDPWTDRMVVGCKAREVRFGFGPKADYRARDFALTNQGSRFILHTPDGQAEVVLGMIGQHNIANALSAAAIIAEVFRISVHQIAACLTGAQGAPGRLQAVRCGQPFAVLVDYAHTDDALKKSLQSLRPLTKGKLRVLFGCGGDRDREKRPLMARATEEFADVIYVTSDNPRSEDASEIIRQITAGFKRPRRKPVFIETDRRAAISKVLEDSEPGDLVLLAGKGHENYQIVGNTRHHFDDVEEVKLALQRASGPRA